MMKFLFTSFSILLFATVAMGSHVLSKNTSGQAFNLKTDLPTLSISGLNPEQLSAISIPALEFKTGRKLNLWQKVSFKLAQKKLKKQLGQSQDLQKPAQQEDEEDRTKGFHMLGFILGFFLGPLGIILSYFIDKEEERANRVKWAFIGWGVSTILVLLLYVGLIILLFSSGI